MSNVLFQYFEMKERPMDQMCVRWETWVANRVRDYKIIKEGSFVIRRKLYT